jgi:hypothetical protein
MIFPPLAPAFPYVAYDGKKSALDEAVSARELDGDTSKLDNDPYVKKISPQGRASEVFPNYEFDPNFDKGYAISRVLKAQKYAGYKFVEEDYDAYLGLRFPAFYKIDKVAGGKFIMAYWMEFFDRSTRRMLNWGTDCVNCAIVVKRRLGPRQFILDYCSIDVASGARGAPDDCVPVMYGAHDQVWLRATSRFHYGVGLGGGVDSGYFLLCKPRAAGEAPLKWGSFSEDISRNITSLNYVPVKVYREDGMRFVLEFGESKIWPRENEWTTVTALPAYPRQNGEVERFLISILANFSLRPEHDPTKHRPAAVDEEKDGLRKIGSAFNDKYTCSLLHQ